MLLFIFLLLLPLFLGQIPLSDQLPQPANETFAKNSTNATAKLPANANNDSVALFSHQGKEGGEDEEKNINLIKDTMMLFLDSMDTNDDGSMSKEEIGVFLKELEKQIDTGHQSGTSSDSLLAGEDRSVNLWWFFAAYIAIFAVAAVVRLGVEMLANKYGPKRHNYAQMLYVRSPGQQQEEGSDGTNHSNLTKTAMDKKKALKNIKSGFDSLLKYMDHNQDGKATRQEIEQLFSGLKRECRKRKSSIGILQAEMCKALKERLRIFVQFSFDEIMRGLVALGISSEKVPPKASASRMTKQELQMKAEEAVKLFTG